MENYKLILSNIKAIGKAEIYLGNNNISMIAGNNNTGKSTILKILFSLIKCSNEEDCDFINTLKSELGNNVVNEYADYGEIELYKEDRIIYKIEISKGLYYKEIINNLEEIHYKDVTYIGNNNILELYSIWELILKDESTCYSTKDIIRKIKINSELDNGNIVSIDSILYNKIYDEDECRLIRVDTVGSGQSRIELLRSIINTSKSENLLLIDIPESGVHLGNIKNVCEILSSTESSKVIVSNNDLLIGRLKDESKVHIANKSAGSIECKNYSIIKYTENLSEIYDQYIEPLSEWRIEKVGRLIE